MMYENNINGLIDHLQDILNVVNHVKEGLTKEGKNKIPKIAIECIKHSLQEIEAIQQK